MDQMPIMLKQQTLHSIRVDSITKLKVMHHVRLQLLEVKSAKQLFPRGDALEKTIKIGNANFKIVGVLAEAGKFYSWTLESGQPGFHTDWKYL